MQNLIERTGQTADLTKALMSAPHDSEVVDGALAGRIRLREGEITLQEAFRRLELPMYGVVAAAARVAGWGFDIYQAVHGRLFDPNVIMTSIAIKNIPPAAAGIVYYKDNDSHAWKAVAGLHVRSQLIKHEPRQYVVEPVKNGIKDGVGFIASSWNKFRQVSGEQDKSLIDRAMEITVGGLKFGTDFTYRTARFGFNVFCGTVRYGYESGKEVLHIGSKVWFVNRSLRRVTPIVTAVDDVFGSGLTVDLPAEYDHALIGTQFESAIVRRL